MSHDETPAARRASARTFYDRISHVYDALADADERLARERALTLLAPSPGERMLEIGFGTGHALASLARSTGPSGRVVGVDISPRMRDLARRRLREAGLLERVELIVGSVPPLDVADDSFDGALMTFVLELFPPDEIQAVLRDTRRALSASGRLVVASLSTPPPGESPTLAQRTYRWLHRHFPHIVDCQPIDVLAELSRAGFRDLEEQRIDIWGLAVAIVRARPRPQS